MNSDFRVGSWLVRRNLNLICRNGSTVQLEPKVMDVLFCLAEHPGEVLPKDTILQAVWPDTYVTDDALRHSVSILRHAFGDEVRNPQIIETIPKRGYRLIAPVGQVNGARDLAATEVQDTDKAAAKSRGHRKWAAGFAVTALLLAALTVLLWYRRPTHLPGRSEWVQITNVADAVSQPAMSPDGRMLAFIRGPDTFMGAGQIYIKALPGGELVQLTNDNSLKMNPVFSPDGLKISYTQAEKARTWNTWEVSVRGGQPHLWLTNASGLTWRGKDSLLFSEIKNSSLLGVHMGIVASSGNGTGRRDVYLAADDLAMAHRSYASPDGKWALVVEMHDGNWLPCRLVHIDGRSRPKEVGPSKAPCTSAAWSPDGKWMYLNLNVGSGFHIWQQRFPAGRPEQITSGPTEEEGIAVASDGRSLITSVGLIQSAVWLHDSAGERQISLEGSSYDPKFSPDGKRLYYRGEEKGAPTVWMVDLVSGRREPLLENIAIDGGSGSTYDLSPDGRRMVVTGIDGQQKHRLWVLDTNHRSAPRQIPGIEGDAPFFGMHGEIFFHLREDSSEFVAQVNSDGTGLRKVFEGNIGELGPVCISPNRRWLLAFPLPVNEAALTAFPLHGGTPVPIIAAKAGPESRIDWSQDGQRMFIMLGSSAGDVSSGRTYILPIRPGKLFPPIPPGGFRSEAEIAEQPGVRLIDSIDVAPGPTAEIYAYTRENVQRNLYRIPLP